MLDALQEWRDARQRLDDAIRYYLERAAALDSNLIYPDTELFITSSLDALVLEVQEDSDSMDHRHKSLKQGQVILNRIRNKSSSRLPTNRLPYEIVLRIFHLCAQKDARLYYDPSSTCFDGHYTLKTLYTLTHVCAGWRSILLDTPSFWSHIDMETVSSSNSANRIDRMRTSLERARNHPLCIDFNCRLSQVREGVSAIFTSGLLQPYLDNLQTIYLITREGHESILETVSSWFSDAQIGSIRSLTIWQECGETLKITGPRSEEYLKNLANVRVLRLYDVHFEWDSPIYHNLLHLQLGGLTHKIYPTLREMLAVLSACPELRILQITNMSVRPSDEVRLQPVILEQLSTLELLDPDPNGLRLLLPMLVLKSESLSVRIDLYPSTDDAGCAILDFLARSNVTRMVIDTWGESEGIVEYLSAVNNLTTLILEFGDLTGDKVLAAMTHSSVPLCPKLHTLYIDDGRFRSQYIEEVVKAYPLIKKLGLSYFNLNAPDKQLSDWLKPLTQNVAGDETETELSFYWYYHMT